MRKTKYRKGALVESLPEAVSAIVAGQYLYEGDKPQHPGWLLSQSLFTLKLYVDNHRMWYAVENTDGPLVDADYREVNQ